MDTKNAPTRCDWQARNLDLRDYHDQIWGVPSYDDRFLFEMFTLSVFQAGLSWRTIYNRLKGFQAAFSNFEVQKVAEYNERNIDLLCQDSSIIRNRMKISATVANARIIKGLYDSGDDFSAYLWKFVDGQPIVNQWQTTAEMPTVSAEAEVMSKEMKKLGFKFAGPTICYAFMQSVGMVNDHIVDCFRHQEIRSLYGAL